MERGKPIGSQKKYAENSTEESSCERKSFTRNGENGPQGTWPERGMFGAAPCAVDVKDGKIVRIRPLHYDSKYDPKQFNPWKITKSGKTLEPLMKAVPPPFSLAYKKRVYSPNRIKYP